MEIGKCRLCGKGSLEKILELGQLVFSGIFPDAANDRTQKGNLKLLLCMNCTLLQLSENFTKELLYGENYGYRSGLNSSMIKHLHKISAKLMNIIDMQSNDIFLDIGSNDGTLLNSISKREILKFGIDPTANKFKDYYQEDIQVVSDFFSEKTFKELSNRKARIITSIAMFYDLIAPLEFVIGIKNILAHDGIWYFEQSYMPWMVKNNAYDTICHEHLEYYSLTSISKLLDLADLQIVNVELNEANGGSLGVYATHKGSAYFKVEPYVTWLMLDENALNLKSHSFFSSFVKQVQEHPHRVHGLLDLITKSGSRVNGIGASTKGSILAQHCNLTSQDLRKIGEVNEFKFKKFLGGTDIPIVPESEILGEKPDYLFVFPWHFRDNLRIRFEDFLQKGGRLIMPLPNLDVISSP